MIILTMSQYIRTGMLMIRRDRSNAEKKWKQDVEFDSGWDKSNRKLWLQDTERLMDAKDNPNKHSFLLIFTSNKLW